MVATTFNVGGKPYPKTLLYAGGAATLGIVGYAWWSKGTSQLPETVPQEERITDRIPATTIPTPSQFGSPPASNADWGELAIERLINIGIDGPAASSAIGKFLQHKPLNSTDADLVRQAIRAAGYPPEGGPWVIIEETTPAAVGLAQPTGLNAVVRADNTALITWNPVTGASGYEIVATQGFGESPITRRYDVPAHTTGVLEPKTYVYKVKAYNSANNFSDSASVTFTVATPTAKFNLRVIDRGRNHITWGWDVIPGATNYVVIPEVAAHLEYGIAVHTNRYTWSGLQPNAYYGLHVTAQGVDTGWERLVAQTLP